MLDVPSIANWLLEWELHPRPFGYEPNEITSSLPSDMLDRYIQTLLLRRRLCLLNGVNLYLSASTYNNMPLQVKYNIKSYSSQNLAGII